MFKLEGKRVLLIGLGARGRAACRLLCKNGAAVVAVDSDDSNLLQQETNHLVELGVEVHLGLIDPNSKLISSLDLGVVSVGGIRESKWLTALKNNNVPVISELELGYQQIRCLNIAVTYSTIPP